MEFITVFFLGAALYGSIEVLFRGWTHWTMLILGGICFCLMYMLSGTSLPFVLKLLLSALCITALEFGTGYLVNITLGWQVWDYSALPLNIKGQICPLFSFLWLMLSIPGLLLCSAIHRGMAILFGA